MIREIKNLEEINCKQYAKIRKRQSPTPSLPVYVSPNQSFMFSSRLFEISN